MIQNLELTNTKNRQTLEQKIIQCHDEKIISDLLFWYFSLNFEVTSASIITFCKDSYDYHEEYTYGEHLPLECIPMSLWSWANKFISSDGLVPISSNTIGWDYRQVLNHGTCLFVLDSHRSNRTYLIVDNIKPPPQALIEQNKVDFLYIAASQWQCIRAERNTNNDIRLRDIRAAKYLDEIKERDQFLDKIKLVQNLSLSLSKLETLDELFKAAIEAVRDDMGFDRSVFMLLDYKQGSFSSTYGTNERGETVREHHKSYNLNQLDPSYLEALYSHSETLAVIEPAPLYTAGEVVGEGWNAMLILRGESYPVGWIALDNYIHRGPITIYQQEILKYFAALLSQIYIRKRREQAVRLLNISVVGFSRCETLSDVCQSAVSFAIKHLGVDRLGILLTNEDCTSLQGTWGTDQQGNTVDESYFYSENLDVVQEAIDKPETLIYTESAPIFHDMKVIGFGCKGIALMQTTDKKPFAFVIVDNFLTKKILSTEEREIINLFISTLSEVLQRTQATERLEKLNKELELKIKARTKQLEVMNKQLEVLSLKDPLTGLGNRRQFENKFNQILSTPRVSHIAVILLDIDFFGLYNTRYGHLQGDKALLSFAGILNEAVENISGISFCRVGGEEFAVCLPDCSMNSLEQMANHIQKLLEAKKIEHDLSSISKFLTVSIGCIVADKNIKNIDQLYHEADIQLYKAKEKRNRICCNTVS